MYHDIPFFMFNEEAPLGLQKMKKDEAIGKIVPFKICGMYDRCGEKRYGTVPV